MSARDNREPAFPCDSKRYESEGMTLRDYFAAKAMQGFATGNDAWTSVYQVAETAYEWADAMIEARNK